MARDEGLETVLAEEVAAEPGLTTKPMFGGLVWLHAGNLCFGARHDGLLARLGPGQDAWALDIPGIRPMMAGPRPMRGWIWAAPDVCGDDALRRRLVASALTFVRTLPPKRTAAGLAVPLDLLGVRDPEQRRPKPATRRR